LLITKAIFLETSRWAYQSLQKVTFCHSGCFQTFYCRAERRERMGPLAFTARIEFRAVHDVGVTADNARLARVLLGALARWRAGQQEGREPAEWQATVEAFGNLGTSAGGMRKTVVREGPNSEEE
jgi:hypothetical protein